MTDRPDAEAIACSFCLARPTVSSITVTYRTPRKDGEHRVYRVRCDCGAHGKCRPTEADAVSSWNEPWQAHVDVDPYFDSIRMAALEEAAKVAEAGLDPHDGYEPGSAWDSGRYSKAREIATAILALSRSVQS